MNHSGIRKSIATGYCVNEKKYVEKEPHAANLFIYLFETFTVSND